MRALICLTAVFALGIPAQSHAQDTTIVRGFVTDASNGLPLPEATVAVVGSELSAQTDAAGVFQLEGLPLGAVTLSRYSSTPCRWKVRHRQPDDRLLNSNCGARRAQGAT
jgi:hypothetical protein